MNTRKLKAVLFDLCDTLFLFDPMRLPSLQIDGQEVRSTLGLVYRALASEEFPAFEGFLEAYMETTRDITRDRETSYREITTEEKFQKVLDRLGVSPGRVPRPVLMHAVQTHMDALASSLIFPPQHRKLVEKLRKRYNLGIVTNFDHPPTVYDLLRREGLENTFDAVVISAELGLRKPSREIFNRALDLLTLEASEVLFIGNDLQSDISGAHTAGIPSVWFNRHNVTPADPLLHPEHTLLSLSDLETIL